MPKVISVQETHLGLIIILISTSTFTVCYSLECEISRYPIIITLHNHTYKRRYCYKTGAVCCHFSTLYFSYIESLTSISNTHQMYVITTKAAFCCMLQMSSIVYKETMIDMCKTKRYLTKL